MFDTSLFEVSSVFRDAVTGRVAVVEALLAFTPDTITLTLRIPATGETFTLTVPLDAATAPLRAALHRSYEPQMD